MSLPPLNAVRAFEAVGRRGSVKQAAEELFVTSGAVSRQLALLEEHLGTALFKRSQVVSRNNFKSPLYSAMNR
ncbi:MAG: LysR family transcriptional regulator [Comamonadaceae bacterium]|nr:MAG: LysR family transcriptional regulator [Comamonadaceae bacterium]